jgi:hypothetical protein
VSQAVGRTFKYLARPYEELARSLKNPDALQNCLQIHNKVYTEDKNLGLITQVLEQQEMQRIVALRDTYVAISLENVAWNVCGSKATLSEDVLRMENLILRLVNRCLFLY